MSLRKSILLGLVLLGALFYIFRVELPKEEQTAREELLLTGVGGESIEQIEVSRSGGNYVLKNKSPKTPELGGNEKDGKDSNDSHGTPANKESWQLANLPDAPLDSTTLGSLLSALSSLKGGKAIKAEDMNPDLGVYGLKEPSLVLKVVYQQIGGATQTVELQFGKKNEYLGERYLRMLRGSDSAPALFLINDTTYTAANKEANAFRKRQIIEFSDSEVKGVSFDSSGSSLAFEPREDVADGKDAKKSLLKESSWKLTSPVATQASQQAISEWLRALRTIRVKEFFDGEAAQTGSFGLSEPQFHVVVSFKDTANRGPLDVILHKGEKRDGALDPVYMGMKGSSSVFLLDGDPFAGLQKGVNDLREHELFRFPVDRVQKVVLERGETSDRIVLARAEDSWTVNEKPGDKTFVSQFLNDLSQVKALQFLTDSKESGFDRPYGKVTVTIGSPEPVNDRADLPAGDVVLTIGLPYRGPGAKDSAEASRYAVVGDSSDVFTLPQEVVNKVLPRIETLVSVNSSSAQGSDSSVGAMVAP